MWPTVILQDFEPSSAAVSRVFRVKCNSQERRQLTPDTSQIQSFETSFFPDTDYDTLFTGLISEQATSAGLKCVTFWESTSVSEIQTRVVTFLFLLIYSYMRSRKLRMKPLHTGWQLSFSVICTNCERICPPIWQERTLRKTSPALMECVTHLRKHIFDNIIIFPSVRLWLMSENKD